MAVVTAAERRRERMREETRQAILDAGRAMVEAEGIDGFSLRGVARAVGYSPAAIYEYFGSKEDLLDCVYFEGRGGLSDRMAAVLDSAPEGQPAIETLRAFGHAYRQAAQDHPELYRMIFGRGKTPTPSSKHSATNDHPPSHAFGLLIDLVAKGIDEGEFIEAPAPMVAMAAWSAVHGFVTLELSGALDEASPPGKVLMEEAAPPSYDALFEGVLY
ncbi:MAG: TetR/AcrR family transcriptional regulator, partial [Thermomicrobiales bacterium]